MIGTKASDHGPAELRTGAETAASGLPPLLAEAKLLAATVLMGEHGRRRAGPGSEFWQYRPVHSGDEARHIDHRRSARSDQDFVRDREWQAAQSVMLWADAGQSMQFASAAALPSKARRAALLALATAVLLVRGGERVGLSALGTPPQRGEVQLLRIAESLSHHDDPAEYGVPLLTGLLPQSQAVFFSDFLGDPQALDAALAAAADRGVRGALVMVLDPEEEAFPFGGRTIFESLGGTLRFETQKARDLRQRYLERLAQRKDLLARLASAAGWHFAVHHTDQPAQQALLWLHGAIGGRF